MTHSDPATEAGGRGGNLVPQHDIVAGAREADRPCAANEAAADYGYLCHLVLPEWVPLARQRLFVDVESWRKTGDGPVPPI